MTPDEALEAWYTALQTDPSWPRLPESERHAERIRAAQTLATDVLEVLVSELGSRGLAAVRQVLDDRPDDRQRWWT